MDSASSQADYPNMNAQGATALLARVYSYKRDSMKAVEYIDELLDEWAVKVK